MSQKWSGSAPSSCQHCGNAIVGAFSDIKTRAGSWAILCDNCVANITTGLYGTGSGQRYVRDSTGAYVKVAG